jgi:cell division protein FtsA
MAKDIFYTAIDLGTTKVCSIIARIGPEGELKVLGVGTVPSQGMLKGKVSDQEEAQQAVKASLEEAQRYMGRGVSWAYLSVSGDHITSLNTTSSLNGDRGETPISEQDLMSLVQASRPMQVDGKEILHVVPISYTVDGLTSVRNPAGLHAENVDVESHVVMGESSVLRNLVQSVEAAKITVRSMVVQPLAAAEAILTEGEREMGAVLVDIGGGTTDVVVFRTGSPWFTTVIPVGGNQVTRDLSVALGVPFYVAEELKIKHSHANPEAVEATEDVHLPGFKGHPVRMIKRRAMCQPIQERIVETLKLVMMRLRNAGMRQMPPAGMVLTGGTAEMPGLREVAERTTGAPVRIGFPTGILGLPQELRKTAYSASVGTLLWGIKHHGEERPYTEFKKPILDRVNFSKRLFRKSEKVSA